MLLGGGIYADRACPPADSRSAATHLREDQLLQGSGAETIDREAACLTLSAGVL